MLNTDLIRKDFPIFDVFAQQSLTYLDSAATSQKPASVIDTVTHYYTHQNVNIHRGLYPLCEKTTEIYENVRGKVKKFFSIPSECEVIFTKNTTESINLFCTAWKHHLATGDEILVSLMEHHANFVPWQMVAQETGAVLKFISITQDGCIDIEDFKNKVSSRTKIVAISHVSNVLGTINPIQTITDWTHQHSDALVLLDAAQSAPHLKVNVQELNCDVFVFSAHKMLGPTGVGVLIASKFLLDKKMNPMIFGGEMISQVYLDHSEWNEIPYKFEGGTANIVGVIGLGAAIDYLDKIGMDKIREHEKYLIHNCMERLYQDTNITVYGPSDVTLKSGVLSFNMKSVHSHDVASILGDLGIAVRVGHHCCQPLMDFFRLNGTVRASFYLYNDIHDIDRLLDGLDAVKRVFKIKKS